jgi:hypothetical protein
MRTLLTRDLPVETHSNQALSKGAIPGIVIGSILLVLLFGVGIFYLIRFLEFIRRGFKRNPHPHEQPRPSFQFFNRRLRVSEEQRRRDEHEASKGFTQRWLENLREWKKPDSEADVELWESLRVIVASPKKSVPSPNRSVLSPKSAVSPEKSSVATPKKSVTSPMRKKVRFAEPVAQSCSGEVYKNPWLLTGKAGEET